MADAKPHNLTSLVTKKTRRAKARLMQNFGKADKTTDELFEVYQINFNRQQSSALNLQKHVKQYLNCLKELHEASKGLSSCLLDMHEKDWPKHDTFDSNAYELDHINEDIEEKIKESVLVPLEQYLGQFSEMREKIAKRGRKLVDYDSQRHSYDALVASQSGKQPDDAKLSKHRDQLEEAKGVYEILNNDLHEELPALYDNRLPFIITVFQRLFASEISYHSEKLSVQKSNLETVEQLAKATDKGVLSTLKPSSGYYSTNHHITASSSTSTSPSSSAAVAGVATTASTPTQTTTATNSNNAISNINNNNNHTKTPNSATVTSSDNDNSNVRPNQAAANGISGNVMPSDHHSHNNGATTTITSATTTTTTTATTTAASGGDQLKERASNNSSDKAPILLHKVEAAYKYLAVDTDELSFEAGEIIQVIEYDNPEDQEEGWLMGIKESDGTKGLFPVNYTRAI